MSPVAARRPVRDDSAIVRVEDLPTPTGWAAVARSPGPGQATDGRIGDLDVVVWRTRAGRLAAHQAHCPHLGAHLGKVGSVVGDEIQCGFHGFCFDADGQCSRTGYGRRVPPRARLLPVPVTESGGIAYVHYGAPGSEPTWTIPDVDQPGWTPFAHRSRVLRGHPLETTENSVDVGHLSWVHGYRGVRQLSPLRTDGPRLQISYGIERPTRVLGLRLPATRSEFDIDARGLGFSQVDLRVASPDVAARLLVLATLEGPGLTRLRFGVSVRRHAGRRRGVPVAVLQRGLLQALLRDAGQDTRFWSTKVHLDRPAIAEGDGPIGGYRHWAAQFMSPFG